MQPAEQYCFCMTRRFAAFIAAVITLIKITVQVSFQTYIHNNLVSKYLESLPGGNMSVFDEETKLNSFNLTEEDVANNLEKLKSKGTSDYANYTVFIIGQVLQILVTLLLLVAIYKENADMMWPYLCWLSLNLLLEGFGCLILVYTNPKITAIMRDFIVYCTSLSLSVALIYFTNNYEKELRRREGKEEGHVMDVEQGEG